MKKDSKNSIKDLIIIIILLLSDFIIVMASSAKKAYPSQEFDILWYYLIHGGNNTNYSLVTNLVMNNLPYIVLIFVILVIIVFINKLIKKEYCTKIIPLKIITKHQLLISFLVLIISLIIGLNNISFFSYLKKRIIPSKFIENNYVDPKKVKLQFPKNKKNLIYIYVESLENSLFDKKNGGNWDYNVMPELLNLLNEKDSIYFSSGNEAQGTLQLDSLHWTSSSLLANTAGIPLKIPLIDYNGYSSNNYMPGAYSLGEILNKNGYNNEILLGSSASLGGIKDYVTQHGNYNVFDVDYVLKNKLKTKEELVNWGFDDKDLLDYAKSELTKLSKKKNPFNLTIMTIDTHAIDGYKTYYTKNIFNQQYENVYATTSEMIYNFTKWIKKQKFYKNTTIIIVGDHIGIQNGFYSKDNEYNRTTYNVLINSSITTKNTKKREFTSLDFYPTTLASLGVSIKGEQLGLGVNLFSNKKTLSEKYGFKTFNNELNLNSKFYNNYILKSDYNKLLKNKNQKTVIMTHY